MGQILTLAIEPSEVELNLGIFSLSWLSNKAEQIKTGGKAMVRKNI